MNPVVKWAGSALLLAHGAMHVIGFPSTWELAEVGEVGAPTFLFGDLPDGHPALLAFGMLWLLAMLAFMMAAIGVALQASWGLPLAGIAAGFSLVPTIVWWQDAWFGALLDLAILGAVAWLGSQPGQAHGGGGVTASPSRGR